MLTREYGNFAGAGGVREMVCQLARHLSHWTGRTVSVVLPLYGFMEKDELGFLPVSDPLLPEKQLQFWVDMNYPSNERKEQVRIWKHMDGRVHLYGLESGRFAQKNDVYVYDQQDEMEESWKVRGSGHFDFFAMNILLQKGAMDLMMHLGEQPDVIHCHDGHTAVLPAMINELAGYRNYFRETGAVVTIHNGGHGYHQEVDDLPFAQAITGLPWEVIRESLLEDNFDPFLAASSYAAMNTVSENYARELQESDDDKLTGWLGHELLRRGVVIDGVTNGIAPEEYDTAKPEQVGIVSGFDIDSDQLEGKSQCKKHLLHLLDGTRGLDVAQNGYLEPQPDLPLFTFIGRLSEQKGVDILLQAIELFFENGHQGQFVVLGSGDAHLEQMLAELAEDGRYHGKCCFLQGFDPKMANSIYAAGDFFCIPSKFEPCGLTDFIAQLFGNLPIVHLVGGLVKVVDGENGFGYGGNSPEELVDTMKRAITVYEQSDKILTMQKHAKEIIDQQYHWSKTIKKYVELYKKAARLAVAE